ncbi:MAG: hypothetical protein AAB605_02005 [Patescibacteria group bacterium]
MHSTGDKKIALEMITDEHVQGLMKDFGLENDTPEGQAEILDVIGETLMSRVVLEILKRLPPEEQPKLEKYFGSGDLKGLMAFLAPHIPDVERFINETVMNELASIREDMKRQA